MSGIFRWLAAWIRALKVEVDNRPMTARMMALDFMVMARVTSSPSLVAVRGPSCQTGVPGWEKGRKNHRKRTKTLKISSRLITLDGLRPARITRNRETARAASRTGKTAGHGRDQGEKGPADDLDPGIQSVDDGGARGKFFQMH